MTTSVTLWLRLVLLLLCVSVSGVLLADSRLNADGGSWLNTDEHGAEGTEFYLTFMKNYGKEVKDDDIVLILYATSRYDANITVTGWRTPLNGTSSTAWQKTFHVEKDKYAYITIPNEVAYMDQYGKALKGLKVTSDKKITLYSCSSHRSSYDATMVYPVEANNKEYLLQTYEIDNESTEFAIVSTEDNNEISLKIIETDYFSVDLSQNIKDTTLVLNESESFLYRSPAGAVSLIGSSVCATHPVAFFQGGQHSAITNGTSSHIFSNTMPTDGFGKNYVVTRTKDKNSDIVYFYAAEDNTLIYRNGVCIDTINQREILIDEIKWANFPTGSIVYKTSRATGCSIFQTSESDLSAPTMTDLTPLESSIKRTVFACFHFQYDHEHEFEIKQHYVNIVLPKKHVGTMMIDGRTINRNQFRDISSLINGEQYVWTSQKISQGSHVLENSAGGFVAHVYGYDKVKINPRLSETITYSYSAGRNILHPAWILIDGKRVNQKAICEGDPPITFTSVINYDYTNVRWEFHSLQGKIYDDTIIRTVRGDSIISRHYVDVEGDSTTSVHIDSVYMIVDRTTPLCGYTITDTIKAAIIVNDTFAIQDRQDVCYGDTMTLHYKGTEVKIPADTLHTYKFGTKSYRFSLNTPYSFVDSLKTNSACDTCKHCDSIINQVRIIRPIYNDTVQDSICVNHLPYQWRDSLGNLIRELDLPDSIKSKLILKTENAYHTETIWDSENFGTIYGCDSIVNIELTVLPIYDLHDYDTVCVDSVRAYSWYRHPYANGKYFYTNGKKVSYIPQNTSGEFEYVDSLKTKGCIQCADSLGCDSIWTLHLKVLDRYIDESWGSICSNESYLWQDTLWLGWNFPEDELSSLTHKYKYVYKRDTTLRITYPTEDAFGCDSTIILHLKIYPAYPEVSYNDTTYVHICENESYEFYGTTYNANGEWRTVDHSIGRQVLTYMDATSHDCDSAVAHVIYVHPTYLDTISVTECQSHTSTYKWTEITETSIWDKQRNKHISPNDIPLNEAGDFIYVDSTKTKTCTDCRNGIGCDSVIVLKLHVNPIFDTIESKPLCENDTLHWRGKTYVGGKAADAIAAGATKRYWATPIPNPNEAEDTYRLPKTYEEIDHKWNGNKYTDSIHFTTKDGCDSIYWLELTVYPSYEIHDTLHVCDNKSIDWEGKTYAGSKFEGAADHNYATSDNWYTDTRSFLIGNSCDSVRILHLKVHPSYDSVYVDSVCQDYSYVWDKHMNRILYDSIQQRDIFFSDSIPTIEPGWHTYVDNLSTTTCAECEDGSCDSIWTLRLYVKPTAVHTEYITICPEQLPYPYGSHGKVATQAGTYLDTIHRSYGDGCDSITTYVITVSEENRSVFHVTICNNELPYNYDYGSTPTANLHFTNLTQSDTYYDTIRIAGMCNHILELDLTINDTTRTDTTYYLCEGDTYVDKDFTDIIATRDTSYVKRLERANSVGCDSVVYVTVRFGATHEVHDADVILCERDSSYTWQTQDTYGTYSQTIKWSDLHETVLDTVLYQTLHTMSPFYCDSVTSVRIQVKPTVYNEYYKTICPTEVPFSDWGNRDEPVSVDGTYTHYIVGGSLRYGCDSIEIMHLTIGDSIVTHLDTTICNNELPYNHISPDLTPNLMGLTTTGIYRQILTSASGCDSTIVLHLTVNDTTVLDTTYYLCEGDTYVDKDFTDIIATRDTSYVKRLERANSVGCDSVVYVTVRFGATHEVHDADVILCERDSSYTWQTQDTYGTYSQTIKWSDLHETVLDTVLYQTLHTMSPFYCDSVTSVRIQVKPTVYNEYYKTICPTEVPFSDWGNRDEPVSVDGTYTHYIVGGSLRYGCDSIEIMHLTIRDSIVTHLYDSICDNQLPYNHWDTRADNLLNLTETGVYRDTLISELTGCDSVLVLHLQVNKTYNTTDTITICASEGSPYIWRPSDVRGLQEIAIPFEIDDRVNVKDKQTLVLNNSSVLLQSVHGCDSLVNLCLIVHPTYELVEVDTVDCQDTIDRYSTWTDQLGGVHQIDISEAGWITIAENPGTIYGCDSIIGIKLYVRPTYRYDSVYTICQDERITWQGKTYAGSHYGYNYQMLSDGKYAEHRDSVYYLYEPGDSILGAGVHHDTIVYPTILGCDSTFYLTLNVLPTSNTILDVSVCDSEGEYVFKTSDKNGTYYDTIPIFPITEMIDSVRKDTAFHMRQRTLKTSDGCDSTVYLHLTVTPTYEYITRAEICKNDTFTWRENGYDKAGIYYDRRITEQGCDSNFILELFVRPVLYIPKTLHACDNQTVMHSDTLWYDLDSVRFAVETTLLWKPGMEIPKPDDKPRELHYYTLDGRCDSIIYQYYLHIHPTYDFIANATICSNESYQLHDSFIYTPAVAYHEPGSNPAVIDTLITDKLKTVTCEECEGKGCDSIFSANIRILPAYKHIDSVTICSNEKYDWQDTILYEPQGDTTITYFYQKSYTTKLGCDSIYEMYLTVHQAYDHDVFDTICSDEYYHFGDTLLNQTGEYLDTLRTIHDCDSIVHLYLTVYDTTIVETYDTICVTEKYYYFGKEYTEPGVYDTITLNDWGCKQYNYLYLEVIDTTAYEIAIGDIICADDEEIIVFYERLSGKTLIEYSVLFDDFGHAQGFEDIHHATLDTTESYFSIPIPRGEVLPHPNPTYFDSQQGINEYVYEDKYAYPIPNLYRFKIIMHNGICGDSLQRKDTTVSFWYPSWIHEQHWNDGIVLYNEIYNGGYKFSKYQWFLNGDSILGATKEYLYVPNQLEMNQRGECNNYYQLAVTRLEDGYTTFTCPICPVLLYDTIVPQKDYFSVVPTIVSKINPTIHILSTRPGNYKITNLMGNQKQGDFAPDANNYAGSINLDEYLLYGITNQLILVTLVLDTGDKRTIKVIIRN